MPPEIALIERAHLSQRLRRDRLDVVRHVLHAFAAACGRDDDFLERWSR